MTVRQVFLAGEGRCDIGNAAANPSYAQSSEPGVVQALLDHALERNWQMVGAIAWKNIRKFRAGGHATAEERNVLGVAQMAREAKADLLVFVRDRDGDRQREKDIARAMAQIDGLQVVGGVAVESIEAWVIAICGDPKAETYSEPKDQLPNHDIACAADMVDLIRSAGSKIASAPAPSLRHWLGQLPLVQTPKA